MPWTFLASAEAGQVARSLAARQWGGRTCNAPWMSDTRPRRTDTLGSVLRPARSNLLSISGEAVCGSASQSKYTLTQPCVESPSATPCHHRVLVCRLVVQAELLCNAYSLAGQPTPCTCTYQTGQLPGQVVKLLRRAWRGAGRRRRARRITEHGRARRPLGEHEQAFDRADGREARADG